MLGTTWQCWGILGNMLGTAWQYWVILGNVRHSLAILGNTKHAIVAQHLSAMPGCADPQSLGVCCWQKAAKKETLEGESRASSNPPSQESFFLGIPLPLLVGNIGRGPGGWKLLPIRNLICAGCGTGNGGGVGCAGGKVGRNPTLPPAHPPLKGKKGGPPLSSH